MPLRKSNESLNVQIKLDVINIRVGGMEGFKGFVHDHHHHKKEKE